MQPPHVSRANGYSALARDFGRVLKTLRGGTPVAEWSRRTGIARSRVRRMEQGRGTVSLGTLEKVARVAGVPVWYVVKMAEEKHTGEYHDSASTG